MLALLLWLAIMPTPRVPGIELDPSDPQGTNDKLIKQCVAINGHCNIWYPAGRYVIYKTITLPMGIDNVVFDHGTILKPCMDNKFIFYISGAYYPPPASPRFKYEDGTGIMDWTAQLEGADLPCGKFVPPLYFPVRWP
jgi:hypothetical protein